MSAKKTSGRIRPGDHFDVFGHHFRLDASGTTRHVRATIDVNAKGDYGADPVGDGTFKMVPSGDIVDMAERLRRIGM